ncbi:MAG: hypothetical protein JNK49_14560 [Planctomycetes bacterium]|nr:hypothetical protein [Planctomycetota bacterium]
MEASLRPGLPSTAALFVAPGFLHLLGNVLFTVQGHGLLLSDDPSGTAQAKSAIGQATARGSAALLAMRVLLGEAGQPPQAAGELLATLAELLKVPLRERRLGFRVLGEEGPAARILVDPQAFCNLVADAVRHLAEAHPDADAGVLQLALSVGAAGGVVVHVDFAPAAGVLPFPARGASWAEALARAAVRCGYHGDVRAHGDRLQMSFPSAVAAPWPEP